jgi:hypothetical protein
LQNGFHNEKWHYQGKQHDCELSYSSHIILACDEVVARDPDDHDDTEDDEIDNGRHQYKPLLNLPDHLQVHKRGKSAVDGKRNCIQVLLFNKISGANAFNVEECCPQLNLQQPKTNLYV